MSTPGPFLLFPDCKLSLPNQGHVIPNGPADASLDVPGYMLKQLEAGEVASFVSTARLVSVELGICQVIRFLILTF